MTTRPFWFWCVFPALTMSLGWGLRGSIGGGPLGAMIPGAMLGLALCLLLGRSADAGRIAAMGAIGIGFGGQETYGQTVGLSLQPATFWWAILGFAVKGAAWGLLGGAFLGIALERVPVKRAAAGFAAMAAGTWAGWIAVNHPKLVYFSNRLEKPREEVWAGLLLGGLLMLAVLRSRGAWRMALYGAIGGGVGFACGASLQPWGKAAWASMPLGWWKGMELTFGALLGAAFGACAWRFRGKPENSVAPVTPVHKALGCAAVAIALTVLVEGFVPVRFGYTVGGALLAVLVLLSEPLAWQTAITATYAAFALDLLKNQKVLPTPAMWAWVILSTAAVSLAAARRPQVSAMFLLLTWAAVLTAFRHVLPPRAAGPEAVTMLVVFVALAVAVALMARQTNRPRLDPEGADASSATE